MSSRALNFDWEEVWPAMNYMAPVFTENGGNDTILGLTTGEEKLLPVTIRTAFAGLARFFAVDVKALRRKYGKAVHRKLAVPLPFHPEMVLLPVKFRESMVKDAGAWGYLVKSHIKDIRSTGDEEYPTQVLFYEGKPARCMIQPVGLYRLVNDGDTVEKLYRQDTGFDRMGMPCPMAGVSLLPCHFCQAPVIRQIGKGNYT